MNKNNCKLIYKIGGNESIKLKYIDTNKDLVPIIYTFLDGKLNTKYGSNVQKNIDFLNKNNILEKDLSNLFDYNKIFIIYLYELIFDINAESYDLNDYIKIVNIVEENHFDNIMNELKEKNKYFFPANTYDHQISFYIEKNDDIEKNDYEYNLVLINSGFGINKNHEKYENNFFNLWKSYKIINEEDLKKILIKIFRFKASIDDKHDNNNIRNYVINIKTLYSSKNDIIRKKDHILKNEDFINLWSTFNEIYKHYDSAELQINYFYDILKEYESNNIDSNFFKENDLINFIKNWNEISNFQDNNKFNFEKYINFILNNNNLFLSNLNLEKLINQKKEKKEKKINEKKEIVSFFRLYEFYFNKNNLYTNPQKSGSCAWFSIFWIIIVYFIKNKEDPILEIKDLINKFLIILKNHYDDNSIFINNKNQISLIDYSLINILFKNRILENNVYHYLKKINNLSIETSYTKVAENIIEKSMTNRSKYEYIINNIDNLKNDVNFFENLNLNTNDKVYFQKVFINLYLKENNFETFPNFKFIELFYNKEFNIIDQNNNDFKEYFTKINSESNQDKYFLINLIIEAEEENFLNNPYKQNIDKIVYSIFDTSNKFICYAEIVNIKDNNYFVINEENKNKLNTISEINISIDTDYNFNYYIFAYSDIYDYENKAINNLSMEDIIVINYKLNFLIYHNNILKHYNKDQKPPLSIFDSNIYDYNNNHLLITLKNLIKNPDNISIFSLQKIVSNEELILQYYAIYNYRIYINSLLYNNNNNSSFSLLKNSLYNNFLIYLDNYQNKDYGIIQKIIYDLIKKNFTYKNSDLLPLYKILLDVNDDDNYHLNNEGNKILHEDIIKKINIDHNYFKEIKNFNYLKNDLLPLFNDNFIYEKYVEIKNDNIIYNGLIYNKFNLPANHYFLLNFLNTEKSPLNCYKHDQNNYILTNKLFNVESYYHENFLIIFIELENQKIKNLKFNDFEVVLDKDINKYPFLIFEPVLCNSYILKKNNLYYLLILANGYEDENLKILSQNDNVKSSILLLEIGNNFIFPNFKSEKQIDLLKNIYCDYGCKEQVMFNFNLENDEGLFRLKNYDVKTKKIKNLDYCKKKKLQKKDYKDDIFNKKKTQILIMLNYEVEPLDNFNDFNDLNIEEEDLINFFNKNPNCTMSCKENKNNLINELIEINDELLKYRNNLSNKINLEHYLDGGIFEIIFNNYHNLFKIMQTNILLNNFDKIKRIIYDCENELNCKEIAEINSYLLISEEDRNKISFVNLVFELLFGKVIKEEQWEKFESIFNNYKSKELRIVNQLMMGKGKSSVITPLLLLNLQEYNKIINLVVPNHLLNQTNKNMIILKKLFDLNFNIFDDSEAKLKLINEGFTKNNLFIFDEFDTMFDPIQSNFNIITEEGNTFFNEKHTEIINNIILKKNINLDDNNNLINIILNSNKNPFLLKHFNYNKDNMNYFIQQVNLILDSKNIKNVNYGMSKRNDLLQNGNYKRWVIPYARKDTPNEGSNFSSILITLVLTIKYFEENDYNFEENDLINMYKKDFILIDPIKKTLDKFDYVSQALDIQKNLPKNKKINNVLKYINEFVIKELKYHNQIKNCSFIDLMNSGFWATGFSGTVNIDLPEIKPNVSKFDNNIIEDVDEKLGVYFALTGTYPKSENDIKYYDDIDSIYKILKNKIYNCLIDIVALFKDYSNKDVILNILKLDIYKDFVGIYLDIKDNIKITDIDGNERDFVMFPEKYIIFFSQRNIVGIDIPDQPNNMTGLAILNENEKYTNVAQGIFRMRKLNKGQTIDIAYNKNGVKKKKVYEILKNNDLESKYSKKTFQELQNLKFLIRNENNKYKQEDMVPLFIRIMKNDLKNNSENYKNEILKILDNQINWSDNLGDIEEKIRNNLREKSISDLENILFSGSNHEINIEKDKEKEKEKEKEKDRKTEVDNIIDEIDSIFTNFNPLIFPKEGDNIKDILDKSSEILHSDDEFSLYLSLNYIYSTVSELEFYFIEYSDNLFLLFFNKFRGYYIWNNVIRVKYQQILLYLRDFPVYNTYGECINKIKKDNLFYRFKNNEILKILNKILNYKILNDENYKFLTDKYYNNLSVIIFLFLMFNIKFKNKLSGHKLELKFNNSYSKFMENNDPDNLDKINEELSEKKTLNSIEKEFNDKKVQLESLFKDYIDRYIKKYKYHNDNYVDHKLNIKNKILSLHKKEDKKYFDHIKNYNMKTHFKENEFNDIIKNYFKDAFKKLLFRIFSLYKVDDKYLKILIGKKFKN